MDALVVLRQLEAAVAERRSGEAQQFLLWLLANMSVHRARQDCVFLPQYTDNEIAYLTNRIAACACQLFADPDYGIDDTTFFQFARVHGHLASILAMSGFNTADHVIQNLLNPVNGAKVNNITREVFNKILLLHGNHSEVILPYENYLASHPKHILWLLLSSVSAQFCLTKQENDARDGLLETLANRVDINAFDESMMGWLCVAWMHCSYATTPARNAIKQTLNRILVAWMGQHGIVQNQMAVPEYRQNKPVLLIINEHFHSGHAMFRCLAPIIEALRSRFYLVGMTEKSKSDSVARKYFDSHYYLEWSNDNFKSIRSTLAVIAKIRPHAVYYPSVGMHLPTILLANLRLAPFQMMSLGHPASTFSAVMDFCLVERQYLNDVSVFSERIIEAQNDALGFVPHAEQPSRSELLNLAAQRKNDGVVRVAIPAAAMKINAEFLMAMQRIERKTAAIVEFHFFPYLNHFASALFRKQVQALLPNSIVHAPAPYIEYLRAISSCEIHISPFPFSSTNSLIDSLLLGLPLVVRQIKNIEAGIDAAIVSRLNIDGMQPQESIEAYVAYACRLIEDRELRQSIAYQIEVLDIEQIFYSSHHEAAVRTAELVHNLVVRKYSGEEFVERVYQVVNDVHELTES